MLAILLLMVVAERTPGAVVVDFGPADGCARLADVIFHAVIGDALSGHRAMASNEHGEETCDDTAATVSRAFTSAMARLDVSLVWGRQSETFCTSRDVTQCAPIQFQDGATVFSLNRQSVARSWRAVQVSVVARVLHGAGVDQSRFSVSGLQRSLAIAFSASPRVLQNREFVSSACRGSVDARSQVRHCRGPVPAGPTRQTSGH